MSMLLLFFSWVLGPRHPCWGEDSIQMLRCSGLCILYTYLTPWDRVFFHDGRFHHVVGSVLIVMLWYLIRVLFWHVVYVHNTHFDCWSAKGTWEFAVIAHMTRFSYMLHASLWWCHLSLNHLFNEMSCQQTGCMGLALC